MPSSGIPPSFDRNNFLKILKDELSTPEKWNQPLGDIHVNIAAWREFKSDRDTVKNISNINEFLKSLLED